MDFLCDLGFFCGDVDLPSMGVYLMKYANRFIELVKEMEGTKEKLGEKDFYLLIIFKFVIFALYNGELSDLRQLLYGWQIRPNGIMLERVVRDIEPILDEEE